MNTEMTIDVLATHDLSLVLPPALNRQVNVLNSRPRIGKEKYYRQALTMDLDGKQVDTGYTMIKSYETFGLIMLCNNEKVYPHAYKRWEWFGKDHYETDDYEVIDLATENVLEHWGYNEETDQLYIANQETPPTPGHCPMCNRKESKYCQTVECVGIVEPQKNDLPTCAYSEEMYKRLMKISKENQIPRRDNGQSNPQEQESQPDRTQLSPEVSNRIDQEIRELIYNVRQRK